jgi:predicted N-acetyltransferase YhbS
MDNFILENVWGEDADSISWSVAFWCLYIDWQEFLWNKMGKLYIYPVKNGQVMGITVTYYSRKLNVNIGHNVCKTIKPVRAQSMSMSLFKEMIPFSLF